MTHNHIRQLQEENERLREQAVMLRKAAASVVSECFVPGCGPLFRWHQEYYDAFNDLREALAATEPKP